MEENKDKPKPNLQFTKGVNAMNQDLQVTKIMVQEKLNLIMRLYVQGYSSAEMVSIFSETFNDTKRNGYKYIAKCKENISKTFEKENKNQLNKAILQYDNLYKELVLQGKYSEAGNILHRKIGLLGLEPAKKTITDFNINNQNQTDLSHLSLEAKKQILLQLNPGTTDTTEAQDAEVIE